MLIVPKNNISTETLAVIIVVATKDSVFRVLITRTLLALLLKRMVQSAGSSVTFNTTKAFVRCRMRADCK